MDNVFIQHIVNGVERINDCQSLATAKVNAIDIIAEVAARANRALLMDSGSTQKNIVIIRDAIINPEIQGSWGGMSDVAKYIPGDQIIFRAEISYG